MSKGIRTVTDLQSHLDQERVWRLKELSILRKKMLSSVLKKTKPTEDELALLRPCIAMIYAHWEGFVKAAATAYLQFVALQRMKHADMSYQFLALAARRSATELKLTGNAADQCIVKLVLEGALERGRISYSNVVDTQSNLWFSVFVEIFDQLGLSWREYELKSKMIDTKLVAKRNAIAHGKYIDVDFADAELLFDTVLELMDQIKRQLVDSADSGAFRRA